MSAEHPSHQLTQLTQPTDHHAPRAGLVQPTQPEPQHPVGELGAAHFDRVDLGQRRVGEMRAVPWLVVQPVQAVRDVQPGVAEQHVAAHRLDIGAVAVPVGRDVVARVVQPAAPPGRRGVPAVHQRAAPGVHPGRDHPVGPHLLGVRADHHVVVAASVQPAELLPGLLIALDDLLRAAAAGAQVLPAEAQDRRLVADLEHAVGLAGDTQVAVLHQLPVDGLGQ
jgi:hypothetical protein